ncbi:MAG: 3-dehydroquinate synthase [Oscillospiraceae bacterium]|nr:3-dehydroquinate synthase [Oscillospiraceae bacterium]
MKTISVHTNTPYDVLVERGILNRCGELIRPLVKGEKCAIITDDNVNALYADRVTASLEKYGFSVVKFVFPHGEGSKNAQTLLDIYAFLCENEITRSDCLIALGGGVVGDITGFAAATFLRGMQYVQLPTSLLAQVDSSVGGKTAIDLKQGKNLVGAFKQPAVVLCDPDALSTLPEMFLSDGMGEVIKYGMIRDAALFDKLCTLDLQTVQAYFDEIIPTCIAIKRDVVDNDPFDHGERMILNFGHTLGHAIEAYYHYETYTHGSAVAAGMCLMTKYNGTQEQYDMLCACCENYRLPTSVEAPLSELLPLCGGDKKRAGSMLRYVVCTPTGTAEIRSVALKDFNALFEENRR